MESLQARASFPSGLPFPLRSPVLSPAPDPGPSSWGAWALELGSGAAEGAGSQASGSSSHTPGKEGCASRRWRGPPASAAAEGRTGAWGGHGGPNQRPGDLGEGEVRGAPSGRDSFTHGAGNLEDGGAGRGAAQKTGMPACEAKVTGRLPASLCPAAAAPRRAGCSGLLQKATVPGPDLRSGGAYRDPQPGPGRPG